MRLRQSLIVLPFTVPFVLHRIYQPINEKWTVKRFGCGCPRVNDTRAWHFNANDFNMIIWIAVMLACTVSWCLLIRVEFTRPRTLKSYFLQFGGIYALLCICMSRLGQEAWL